MHKRQQWTQDPGSCLPALGTPITDWTEMKTAEGWGSGTKDNPGERECCGMVGSPRGPVATVDNMLPHYSAVPG